jgi:hypothetical protein
MKKLIWGGLSTLVLFGCSVEGSDDVESLEQPIISGTAATVNSQYVAIYHQAQPDSYVNAWYWFPRPCSGAVIYQNNVSTVTLTAGHCVTRDLTYNDASKTLATSQLRLSTAMSPGIVPVNSNGTQTASPPASAVTPTSVVIHGTLDVALIFSGPLGFPGGAAYTPVKLGLQALSTWDPNGTAVDFGYGQNNTSDPDPMNPKLETSAYGAGTLRFGTSQTRFSGSSTCASELGLPAAALEEVDFSAQVNQPWHGDSGGPSFDYRQFSSGGTVWRYQGLVGVHSTSDLPSGHICNTLTNSYVTWIDQQLAAVTGTFGFLVSPLASPRNRELYVTSATSGNTADLTLNTWPVGTRWVYDPATLQMKDWLTNRCLTGSGSGASGTSLYTTTCSSTNTKQKWTVTSSLALKNGSNGRCLVNATVQSGSVRVTSSDQTVGPNKPYLAACDGSFGQMWYFGYNL